MYQSGIPSGNFEAKKAAKRHFDELGSTVFGCPLNELCHVVRDRSELERWSIRKLLVLRQVDKHEVVVFEVGNHIIKLDMTGEKMMQEENRCLAIFSIEMETGEPRHYCTWRDGLKVIAVDVIE